MGSVKEMSREELIVEMKANRQINEIGDDSSPYWKRAFQLYREAGGGNVSMDCGTCWNKVRDWILKSDA